MKTDEHALHSPFFFHFYKNFLKKAEKLPLIDVIEEKRARFLSNKAEIEITDLGAGSKTLQRHKRRVRDIASHSLSPPKFSSFLNHLIQEFQFTTIIELGTCLGINTAYLAAANQNAKIITFEGDEKLMSLARKSCADYNNIQFIQGNIDDTLPNFLANTTEKLDLVYVDANHTYKATINYFNQLLAYHHQKSVFIFDDIHWSPEMKRAWEEIKQHPCVNSSIDIFDAGLLFFNPDFQKQHYVLGF